MSAESAVPPPSSSPGAANTASTIPPPPIPPAAPAGSVGGAAPPSQTTRGVAAGGGGLRAHAQSVVDFVSEERLWLLLAVPYLLAWIAPFRTLDAPLDGILRWCSKLWFDSESILAFQPLVPFAVILLVISRRPALQAQWTRVCQRYPANDARRRGNPLLFLIGCLALIFSYCVQVKGIAIGSEIVVAIGAVYWAYGPIMLKALALPLAFLCLMIPPPDTLTTALGLRANHVTSEIAAHLIHIVSGLNCVATMEGVSYFLRFPNYGFELPTSIVDGSGNLINALAIMFWYVLYRRLRPIVAITLLALSGFLAILLNVVRIMIGAFAYSSFPPLYEILIRPGFANHFVLGWVISVGACLLAWQAARLIFSAALRAPRPLRSAMIRASQASDAAARPLTHGMTAAGRGMSRIWTRSEHAIEAGLSRLFPKRRRRRGGSSRGRRW